MIIDTLKDYVKKYNEIASEVGRHSRLDPVDNVKWNTQKMMLAQFIVDLCNSMGINCKRNTEYIGCYEYQIFEISI